MKLKIKATLLVSFLFVEILFPQISPRTFYLNGNKKIAKTLEYAAPNSNSITDIAAMGDTVWLGTDEGISLTTDGGNSWTNFTVPPPFNSGSASALGYDKYNGVFWVAVAYDTNTSSGSVQVGSGLRYTSDNGKTWTTISQPMDSTSDSVLIYGNNKLSALPVIVPEENVIYDIAFTPNAVWIATWSGGLRKSTDMGKTWQRVVLPPDDLDSIKPTDTLNFCYSPVAGTVCNTGNLNLEGFSVIAVDSLTLYVGTAGGINKSTDGGISWTKFNHSNQTNPISGNWVVALAYDYSDNTIWAATRSAQGNGEFYAVSYSSDGGLDWHTTLPTQTIWNFSVQGSRVIAAADEGVFMTSDKGLNWNSPGTVIDANTGISIKINTYYSAAFQGSNIWLGSGEGLAKLTENNNGWNGTWKVFTASQPLSTSSNSYAYPNPFNPNTDILKIKYSTNGNSIPVTIRIFDFSMHIVRTVIQDAQRGNPTHIVDNSSGTIDYWDGRNDRGSIVPNGVYFYRVDTGSGKPVYGKILVLH
jgi:ligand-binding sensor domain-containing protein